jgi:uncharacterized protein
MHHARLTTEGAYGKTAAMRLELKRRIYIAAGFVSLALAIIGIPVPLLPTTPFLILAAFFFSRGSQRFHDWLVNHRHFGPPIRHWREQQSIPLGAKILSTSMAVAGYALVLWIYPDFPMILKAGYPIMMLPVIVYVWTRKSK